MGRNIVVCCDGTSNQFTRDNTNVVKLCQLLVKDSDAQTIYYHPGLGTRSPLGFQLKSRRLLAQIGGLAFGYGIKQDVAELYQFVMDHWRPGDRLYLFGFSRGAYTVRVLAALIYMYGLAMPGNGGLVPYAVRMLWSMRTDEDDTARERDARFALASQFHDTLGQRCPIHFLGVWDTVSSVGWVGSPISLPFTRRNPDIAIARHAVSIDERRAFFRTNLLEAAPGQDLLQVWFPGDHCDVGGGHPLGESGLSDIALGWMIGEARSAGLLFDEVRVADYFAPRPDGTSPCQPQAPLHNSLSAVWKLAEFAPKHYWNRKMRQVEWRINRFRKRWLGNAPAIAETAWQRDPPYSAALPADAVRVSVADPVVSNRI